MWVWGGERGECGVGAGVLKDSVSTEMERREVCGYGLGRGTYVGMGWGGCGVGEGVCSEGCTTQAEIEGREVCGYGVGRRYAGGEGVGEGGEGVG